MEYESNVVNTTFTVIARLGRMSSFYERYTKPLPGWRDTKTTLPDAEAMRDTPMLARDDKEIVCYPKEISRLAIFGAELRVGKQGRLQSKQVSSSGKALSEIVDPDLVDRGLPTECVVRGMTTTENGVSANIVFAWCADKDNVEGGYLKMNGVLPMAELMASRKGGVGIDDHVRRYFRAMAELYAKADNVLDLNVHLMNFQYGVRCVFDQRELYLFFEAVSAGAVRVPSAVGIRPARVEWREESVTFKNRHYHKSVRVTICGDVDGDAGKPRKIGSVMISEMGVMQIWGVRTMRQMFEIMQYTHVSIGWALASPEWSGRIVRDYNSQEKRIASKRKRSEKTLRSKQNLRLTLGTARSFKTGKGGQSATFEAGSVVVVPYSKWRVRDLRGELATRGVATTGMVKEQMFKALSSLEAVGVESD